MFALASWLTNTQAGGLSIRVQQKLNGRVLYLAHEESRFLQPKYLRFYRRVSCHFRWMRSNVSKMLSKPSNDTDS
jgi:hypothetical protein